MEIYTGFAGVYDIFMDDVPYQEWADFLDDMIRRHGISRPVMRDCADEDNLPENGEGEEALLSSERNLVLDLGCGTGTLTKLLAGKGYDMIGVDLSQEMLNIAMEKKESPENNILYLCQDMRMLDLYSTVGTVVSVCDSLNYLLEDEDVVKTFSLVNRYLYPGGIFIFDFNTVYKYEQVIGDATIAENRDDCSFIWENYYHEDKHINEYDLTVFAREKKGGLFRRFLETHYQRGYTVEEMRAFVERAGMKTELILDAETHEEPRPESERVYIIAREKGKEPVRGIKKCQIIS